MPSVAVAHRCSPVSLAAAAQSFASNPEAAERTRWLGLAYPVAARVIEVGCIRVGQADPDGLTLAFLEGRLLDLRVVEKIGKATSPVSYLETTARNFVRRAQREASRLNSCNVDVGMLANLGCGDEDRTDEEGEEPTDRLSKEESSESGARLETLLNEVAGMSPRDRILLVASYAGVGMLSVADREVIASRRGVTLDSINEEIDEETARCTALRRKLSARLEPLQEQLERACERNERAFRNFKLVPSHENSAEVVRQNLAVQRLWSRRDELVARIEDPFCGSPNRRAIALLIGEVPPGGDLDTATNSAWKRARRLAAALARKS